jgi:ribonuclease J
LAKQLTALFVTGKASSHLPPGHLPLPPYLTDHSAYDAYMLQIDVAGKRIFYSGDFRIHGRKASLVNRLMATPPTDIDVLLMEGTNLGSNKPCMTEDDLEQDYVNLFRETQGRVFVSWSAQNIDRTVTLFRACKKTGRTLVIDLYTAEVLELLASQNRIPMPDWQGIKVVVTRSFAKMYKQTGRGDFVNRMAKNGIAARALNDNRSQWVIMTRPSLIRDYEYNHVTPDTNDAWSWGLWSGYLKNEDGLKIQQWFDSAGARAAHIHTSGHASSEDLRLFANSMKAKTMVPIHGLAWDDTREGFPSITRLQDNEPLIL